MVFPLVELLIHWRIKLVISKQIEEYVITKIKGKIRNGSERVRSIFMFLKVYISNT